jgi:hypothetical protein
MDSNKRKLDVFEVGTVVEVERRGREWFTCAMPENGGAGKVQQVNFHEDGSVTYDVKYFVTGRSERFNAKQGKTGVLPQHISLPPALEKRKEAERDFLPVGDIENEKAAARAAQRVLELKEVTKRRARKAASMDKVCVCVMGGGGGSIDEGAKSTAPIASTRFLLLPFLFFDLRRKPPGERPPKRLPKPWLK